MVSRSGGKITKFPIVFIQSSAFALSPRSRRAPCKPQCRRETIYSVRRHFYEAREHEQLGLVAGARIDAA